MRGSRTDARQRRHRRVRKELRGTAARPRMAVYRSNRYIYVQIIDDEAGPHTGKPRRRGSSRRVASQ